jgi:hypothetical protein
MGNSIGWGKCKVCHEVGLDLYTKIKDDGKIWSLLINDLYISVIYMMNFTCCWEQILK